VHLRRLCAPRDFILKYALHISARIASSGVAIRGTVRIDLPVRHRALHTLAPVCLQDAVTSHIVHVYNFFLLVRC
jgi:hypothetical protein